jgi:restriction endonuclease Mrr
MFLDLDKIKKRGFFDLQMEIDQEIKNNGLKRLSQIAEEVISYIKATPPDKIPTIIEVLKYIFKCSSTDNKVKNELLNQIDKYVSSRDNLILLNIALELLSECRPDYMLPILTHIAKERTEDNNIRLHVLQCLRKIDPKKANNILLLDILEENNVQLSLAVLDVLEHYKDQVAFKETQDTLEQIFRSSENLKLRCRAVELLGIFGEIDIIERICMLPLNEPEIQASVQKMVQHIYSKPRNILYIRPENFEHLIKEWLVKIGYEQVEVTQLSNDGGVDVIAYKQGQGVTGKTIKVIVQCKRYANKPILDDVLEQLIDALKKHGAKEGLLVTTSIFANNTKLLAENNRFIELIDRNELQVQLDKAFGEGCYCIINRN